MLAGGQVVFKISPMGCSATARLLLEELLRRVIAPASVAGELGGAEAEEVLVLPHVIPAVRDNRAQSRAAEVVVLGPDRPSAPIVPSAERSPIGSISSGRCRRGADRSCGHPP